MLLPRGVRTKQSRNCWCLKFTHQFKAHHKLQHFEHADNSIAWWDTERMSDFLNDISSHIIVLKSAVSKNNLSSCGSTLAQLTYSYTELNYAVKLIPMKTSVVHRMEKFSPVVHFRMMFFKHIDRSFSASRKIVVQLINRKKKTHQFAIINPMAASHARFRPIFMLSNLL